MQCQNETDRSALAVLILFALSTFAYFFKGNIRTKLDRKSTGDPRQDSYPVSRGARRCIVKKMEEASRNCVVFFGSQTGNAQDFAEKLAKEAHARFGLDTMVADLEDYDYETLVNFPDGKIAIFVLATYGEGEPTDNAVNFCEFILDENPAFSEEKELPLQKMRYAAFGLGNSTYEHFNGVVRNVDNALRRLGATRISTVGEGDDAKGTMEEDFLSWKDEMWAAVCKEMNLRQQVTRFESSFVVSETHVPAESVFLGELSKDQLPGTHNSTHGHHNPFIAPITMSKELFTAANRNCLHLELNLRGSDVSYQTGDHLAVWPVNADAEVDRFLSVFGLLEKRHKAFQVSALDANTKVPFPTPTTYDAAVRYYMEICGSVSRQFMSTLAEFETNERLKAELVKLGKDRNYFADVVSSKNLNLAQVIEELSPDNPFFQVPFAVLIEGTRTLQPRYYSISSSSLVQSNSVSITAVVVSVEVAATTRYFKGVTTNYLLAFNQKQHADTPQQHPQGISYALGGPRDSYKMSIPVHIRHSNFKLPNDITRPIIMIGPGTGVAPFRAFVQERTAQAKSGNEVGKMLLFFGCRKESEDFIYKDEWQVSPSLLSCIWLIRCCTGI
jgi:NADPH-ferrihemoprotein reductase